MQQIYACLLFQFQYQQPTLALITQYFLEANSFKYLNLNLNIKYLNIQQLFAVYV
jgi:hypothetical protein